LLEYFEAIRQARRLAALDRERPRIAEARWLVELDEDLACLRQDVPGRDEMTALCQLRPPFGGEIDPKDLAVNPHVRDDEDRPSVGGPRRLIDGVRKVGGEKSRRAACRRHHE